MKGTAVAWHMLRAVRWLKAKEERQITRIAAPAAVLDFATFVEEFLINPITRQPFVTSPNRRRPLLSTLSGSARTVS